MLIPLLSFGQLYHPCLLKSMPELTHCISWCCWRAREVHWTGQPGAISCLRSRERSTRCPSASELIPWDTFKALPGGPPRPTFPSPVHMVGHMARLHPVCVWGWVALGVRLMALPWAPQCPDGVSSFCPEGSGEVLSRVKSLRRSPGSSVAPVWFVSLHQEVFSPQLCKCRAGIGYELL